MCQYLNVTHKGLFQSLWVLLYFVFDSTSLLVLAIILPLNLLYIFRIFNNILCIQMPFNCIHKFVIISKKR